MRYALFEQFLCCPSARAVFPFAVRVGDGQKREIFGCVRILLAVVSTIASSSGLNLWSDR